MKSKECILGYWVVRKSQQLCGVTLQRRMELKGFVYCVQYTGRGESKCVYTHMLLSEAFFRG